MIFRINFYAHRIVSLILNSKTIMIIDGARHYIASILPWRKQADRDWSTTVAIRRWSYTHLRFAAKFLWQKLISSKDFKQTSENKLGYFRYPELTCKPNQGEAFLKTSLVLREPTSTDKGVLYISFEVNLLKMISTGVIRKVLDKFYIVCASSWSPTDYSCFAHLAKLNHDDPIFFGISNHHDIAAYKIAAPAIEPISLLASDMIDPEDYEFNKCISRDIDIIMIAHWAKWKRHWMLFEALRNLPSDLQVVLIGRNVDGRTSETILNEARAFNVQQQITTFTNINHTCVRELLSRSKVSTILSLREGSCVSVAEALASGCPVVGLKESHIGALSYLNHETGYRVAFSKLGATIENILENPNNLNPKLWYKQHSGCWKSSSYLETQLVEYANSKNRNPCSSLAPVKWTYIPMYANFRDEIRFKDTYDFLHHECGVQFEKFTPPTEGTTRRNILHPDLKFIRLYEEINV